MMPNRTCITQTSEKLIMLNASYDLHSCKPECASLPHALYVIVADFIVYNIIMSVLEVLMTVLKSIWDIRNSCIAVQNSSIIERP